MVQAKSRGEEPAIDSGTSVGSRAPDFTLSDGRGQQWRLSDQLGKTVVLLFYPGDETPVCTKQLCSVRDHWSDYLATGAEVVGISTNTVESHERFAAHHDLPLPLLADVGGKVTELFDMRSWLPGRSARGVIVIDKTGVIRYRKVEAISLFRPKDEQIIEAIRQAQGD
jgi:thioredoxin-dependent peroxiredoxin